jgi:hypothetical protein
MLQAEWERVINGIEKAIQKATASNKECFERSIKENNALMAAPLNSLADQFERYKIQQQSSDERRAQREIATIVGLGITGLFTLIAAIIFYFQLNQMRIAIRHTDDAARTQHSDTLTALQKAEDANANAKETAERQLQAYVGVERMDLKAADLNDSNYKPAPRTPGYVLRDFLLVTLKNYGLTPAYDLRIWVNWQPMP